MKPREISLSVILFLLFSLHILSERVISLSPSITEILYEMDLGSSIVGNTKFCNYPDDANHKKKIGGYLDMNIEMIIDLNPDTIIHYPEHSKMLKPLNGIVKLIQVSHRNIEDLIKSIKKISTALNVKSKGELLIKRITDGLNSIRMKKKGAIRKKVMIVIGGTPMQLKNLTIIGKGNFLNEIIKIAGGENAYTGNIAYPLVSIESIIKMNPDIIIQFSFMDNSPSEKKLIGIWEKFPSIRAVFHKNIQIIKDDYWARPGPRIVKIAESLYKILLRK